MLPAGVTLDGRSLRPLRSRQNRATIHDLVRKRSAHAGAKFLDKQARVRDIAIVQRQDVVGNRRHDVAIDSSRRSIERRRAGIVKQKRYLRMLVRIRHLHRHSAVSQATTVGRDAAILREFVVDGKAVLMPPYPEYFLVWKELRELTCRLGVGLVGKRREVLVVGQDQSRLWILLGL